ncbi:MAG: CHASE3 domain-containing protein [Rhizobacter sp.]|jgi:signal transduction histidine kinase
MKNFIRRFRRSAITFPLAVITALSLMAISESSYRSSVDSLDRLGHLAVARINNLVLIRQVLDAENGQRGYLITGRPEYLEPYRKTMDNIGQTMRTLQDFYAKEPQPVTDFTVLAGLVNRKLSEMDTTIQLRSEGREDAWRAVIETDIGREQMEAIRVASERLFKRETDQITARRASVYQTLQLSRLGVAAMTALSVLAFFMYLRQTATLDQERRRQQLALQVERDLLEHQVKGRTAQLTELAHHLQTAREDERNRLARDLHDELGALLTAAKLDVARLKSRIGTITPEAQERITHLNETLNDGIALKRRIIEDLRPSSLNNLGLVAALEILSREFAERSGIPVTTQLEAVRLKQSSELTIYRLVQEALTNIAKYAQAKHVAISVQLVDGRVEVTVKDDGVGFDTSVKRPMSHGLLGMRYRVEAEGGQMALQARPGEGTQIRASLPQMVEPPAPAAGPDAPTAPSE